MNKYFTNKWERKVRDFCDSQYEIIDVKAGDIHYNYKCHLNATHYAIRNSDEKLALVVYRENEKLLPCVHFINYHDNKFIDNTIGEWCVKFEYRFIRWVPKEEFFSTPNILDDTQKVFRDMTVFPQKVFGDINN